MSSLEIVDCVPEDKWTQFVEEHPAGNIFHTPFMTEVFRGAKHFEPFVFAAVNHKNKDIQSLIVGNRVRILDGALGRFSSRMICYGGVVHGGANGSGLERLLAAYDEAANEESLFSEIRNMDNTGPFKDDMTRSGYEYEEYLNYQVDLRRDPATILRSFSKGRRSNIRTLEKKGACVEEVTGAKGIETVYDIIYQTYRRARVPMADISLFESAMEHLFDKGMVKLLLAKVEGKYAASLVALLYKGVIITWYYGSIAESQRLSPASWLIWHIIKWGSLRGYRSLDFGGAGRPNEEYGVRDYKARFGGQLTNYGRYTKVYCPTLLNFAKIGYEVYRRVLFGRRLLASASLGLV